MAVKISGAFKSLQGSRIYISATPPVWVTEAGSLGMAYEGAAITPITLQATQGATFTYSISAGSLPDGLTLAANGIISGIPNYVASTTVSSFTVSVVNDSGLSSTREFSFEVRDIPGMPEWVTPSGSIGEQYTGQTFNYQLQAVDPNNNLASYTITSGALPTGLVMNPYSGTISGTITDTAGVKSFTVTITDDTNLTSSRAFSITVKEYGIQWITPEGQLADISVGGDFTQPLQAVRA